MHTKPKTATLQFNTGAALEAGRLLSMIFLTALLVPGFHSAQTVAPKEPIAAIAPQSEASRDLPKAGVEAAGIQAARFLPGSQELCIPDPCVGLMGKNELAGWQAQGKPGLSAPRSEAQGEGVEWPYEGVCHSELCELVPCGYPMGGNAIVGQGLFAAGRGGEDLLQAGAAIHCFALCAIDKLPDAERAAHRTAMARFFWETRGEDGTWNDRIFPQAASYSTGAAALAFRASNL